MEPSKPQCPPFESPSTRVKFHLWLVVLTACWAGSALLAMDAPPGPVEWFKNYGPALEFSQQQRRPLLVMFKSPRCAWCRRMEEDVLTQPDIQQELAAFVCVQVDVDRELPVALAYGVRSLPRIVVANVHGEMVGDWLGYQDAPELIRLLQDIQSYTQEVMGTLPIPRVIPVLQPQMSSVPPARMDPNHPDSLAEVLGHADPRIRQQAKEVLAASPEGLALALELLRHDYLGVRLAAWSVLRRQVSDDTAFDPWAAKPERTEQISRIKLIPAGPPSPAG